jgi:hypothetical protein
MQARRNINKKPRLTLIRAGWVHMRKLTNYNDYKNLLQ